MRQKGVRRFVEITRGLCPNSEVQRWVIGVACPGLYTFVVTEIAEAWHHLYGVDVGTKATLVSHPTEKVQVGAALGN